MIVQELRNAVVDTVEFLIPPFLKLAVSVIIAGYITYGNLTNALSQYIPTFQKSLDASQISQLIKSLYLDSVVPILVILIIILLAYVINRVVGFFGSLLPIYFSSSQPVKVPNFRNIIYYFPEAESLRDLDLRVNQIFNQLKSSGDKDKLSFSEYYENNRNKKFGLINFFSFLILWSFTSYYLAIRLLELEISILRLIGVIIILFGVMISLFFQIAKNELDFQTSKYLVIEDYLKISPGYEKVTDSELMEKVERTIRVENYYFQRWWSLSFGYRLDWFQMYKHYRPPFYWRYIRWREKRKFDA